MIGRVRGLGLAAVVAAFLVTPVPTQAQEGEAQAPLSNGVLAGAAGVMYVAPSDHPGKGMTMVHFAPTFLSSMGHDILFEGEVHFTPSADGVETELEYAQIDFQRFENVQIVAGQFLLPFGVFGERLHMSWINKMPDLPTLYADEPVPEDELMSLPSDFGLMVRYATPLSEKVDLNVSLFATQGPHEVPESADGGPPEVSLGNTLADNNTNKLLGARAGVVLAPDIELYASGFFSTYDNDNALAYDAANFAGIWRPWGSQVLGEVARVWQQFLGPTEVLTLGRTGYFLQAARRFGPAEPVVRWEQLLEGKADGEVLRDETHRFSIGIDYWLDTTMPVKVAYEWKDEGSDSLILQWVFGF